MHEVSLEYAKSKDKAHPSLRSQFHIPNNPNNPTQETVYLCGNSLGLQPKITKSLINQELDVWASQGVLGHFKDHPHGRPWANIDDIVTESMAKIVGAQKNEVAIMNSLSANLHFLMVSFYTPTKNRFKILMEGKAFPSDYFVIESQVKFHGYDPKDSIIQVQPRNGEYGLRTEDILKTIKENGNDIALILFSGVQYYTGQLFDMETITKAGHQMGCMVGFDLAHAVGNVPLHLHDWNVDFAAWCTYKYLNSGPGNIGGAFVHSIHFPNKNLPKLNGWWGQDVSVKFEMTHEYVPTIGCNSYRLSNPCVISVMALHASLEIFNGTSMKELNEKSKALTGYLEFLVLRCLSPEHVKIITPESRGCQLSLLFLRSGDMVKVFDALMAEGIIVDERKPNVLRISPAPLYNKFEDVWKSVDCIKRALK